VHQIVEREPAVGDTKSNCARNAIAFARGNRVGGAE